MVAVLLTAALALLGGARPPLAGRRCAVRASTVQPAGTDAATPSGSGLGAHLPVPPALADMLRARGIVEPTPIQEVAFSRVLAGESVVLHAETGSGKSLAFLLPTLLRLCAEGAEDDADTGLCTKLLVVAPTRELAVQLGAEARSLLDALGETSAASPAVELVVVGTAPSPAALGAARVLVGTPAELHLVLCASELDAPVAGAVRAAVLDEVDRLLPVTQLFGPEAARRKRKLNQARTRQSATETLLLGLLERNTHMGMQVVAASATASKPICSKLQRVLRRDQLGRWFDAPPAIVRPAALVGADLMSQPRAVTIPAGVTHLTRFVQSAGARELARALREAHEALRPRSALVFVCKSAGITVREATEALRDEGLPAAALHEALGLTAARARVAAAVAADQGGGGAGAGGAEEAGLHDVSATLLDQHGVLTGGFGAAEPSAGPPPLVVTFEDNARGLHFDAVDVVYIAGKPSNPATYLHLAGRTGRQPVLRGTVVTLCTRKAARELHSWSAQLGGVTFGELGTTAADSRAESESSSESGH